MLLSDIVLRFSTLQFLQSITHQIALSSFWGYYTVTYQRCSQSEVVAPVGFRLINAVLIPTGDLLMSLSYKELIITVNMNLTCSAYLCINLLLR